MINKYLFEKVIDVSNKGQYIDKLMIRRLVRDVVSKTDLVTRNKYKYTCFKNSDIFCGLTKIAEGKICFSIETCYDEVDTFENASMLEKNLHIIAIILHEIEHLKEPRKIRKNGFDGKIIRISDIQGNYLTKDGDVNTDIYYSDPSEKIAFANSYKKLVEYLEQYPNFKEQYYEEFKNISNEYLERLFYGYKKRDNGEYNTPLIDFLVAIKKVSSLKELKLKIVKKDEVKNIKRLNLETRLMYGLPIDNVEVEDFKKNKVLMKKV